jgi:membrane-associated phospholipid phosphatase
MISSWAVFLQRASAPWMDTLVYMVTMLGSETFYTIALPIVYWCIDKRKGYRLGLVFLFSTFVNSFLKFAFHTPRPPVPTVAGQPRVIHPETGGGYSFPSGHTQGSASFWGWLAVEYRRRWFWIAAAVIIVLVGLSRVYLNVHWPIDIVGGFIIGSIIVAGASFLFGRLNTKTWSPWLRVGLAIVLPLILFAVHHTDDTYILIGLLIGMPIGREIEDRHVGWTEKALLWQQIVKLVIGMAGFMGLRYGIKAIFPELALFDVLRYAIIGVWVAAGAPWVFKRLRLEAPKEA